MALTFFRTCARAARMSLHLARGWWTLHRHFPRLDAQQRGQAVQQWATGMLQRMGVTLQVEGIERIQPPTLLVANHLSWLDILVLHASQYCRFVSKDEVRHWPLIGALASGAGTLYIERSSRRDAQRMTLTLANALQQGDLIAVFPEGTTHAGPLPLPFHGNLLQAAIAAGCPAQPVALAYVDARTGTDSRAPVYVGDDRLLPSIWRTLSADRLCARVRVGAPELAGERDRRAWAEQLRQHVIELQAQTAAATASRPEPAAPES